MNQPRMPPARWRSAGPLLSATSTSPLGRTYSQRGCDRSLANARTVIPFATVGVAPSVHPTARATFTTGIHEVRGGGSVGFGPMVASMGRRAEPPHDMIAADAAINSA